MKVVGIRELKARLSRYLRDVQAGDVILVTDRGRVVAELRQPGLPAGAPSDIDMAYSRLAVGGGLRVGEPREPDGYCRSPLRVRSGTAKALLAAERDER